MSNPREAETNGRAGLYGQFGKSGMNGFGQVNGFSAGA
jgi:hypothetical protein